jgi:hypothetical protein
MSTVLDASAALLASGHLATLGLPDDEIHREILLPLLPAMLADKAIRSHWFEKPATGFVARVRAAIEEPGRRPLWQAPDFEIHVTASYLAGADARALADTLLSEEVLREMAAAIMNAAMDVVWEPVAIAPPVAAPVSPEPEPEVLAEILPAAAYAVRDVHYAKGLRNRARRRILRIAGEGTFVLRRGVSSGAKAIRTVCRR